MPTPAVDLHSDMQLDLAREGQDPRRTYEERHLPGLTAGDVHVTILSTVSALRTPAPMRSGTSRPRARQVAA